MAAYADSDPSAWSQTLDKLRGRVGKAAALEAAAREVSRELYETYAATTALARIYAVVPYSELEPAVQAFVNALAQRTGEATPLPAQTPVLVLMATHGAKPEWCDRTTSVGHRGIPLLSAAFVEAIPMVARLLKELGVDLAWLDATPEVNARRLLGGFNGLFFVDDAESARDQHGRRIIPAQDFVEEQGVKTVFGMVISLFKGETFGVVRARKFFDQRAST
jgi:hypothetical protein